MQMLFTIYPTPTLEIPLTSELTQQSVTQGEEEGEGERRVPKVANSEALHARPLLGVPEKESTKGGRLSCKQGVASWLGSPKVFLPAKSRL